MKNTTLFISFIFLAGIFVGLIAMRAFRKPPAAPSPATHIISPPPIISHDTLISVNHSLTQKEIATRERHTLDSLSHLDELASIWAINYYIQSGRFPFASQIPAQYRRHP